MVPRTFALPEELPAGRVFVTGAHGQLGTDVMRLCAACGVEAMGMSRAALDVTDAAAVQGAVAAYRPTTIIHCAAWTAVDDAEAQEPQALLVNETGTRNVATAAGDVGALLIHVSTDYVFDGADLAGYTEDAAVAPINAYGRTKLAAEVAARTAPAALVARTSWLFGEHGPNFVNTIARLAQEREEISVVVDQRGTPTWSLHLARALLVCAARRLEGTAHLAGSPVATWHDLATVVVEQLGSSCVVNETTSDAFPRPARRPACSILRSTRADVPVVGPWREGVAALLAASATNAPSG